MPWIDPREQAEQERRWGSSQLAKSMLALRGSVRGAQAMAQMSSGAEHRFWMSVAASYALRAKWTTSVQSAGAGGDTGPPVPPVTARSFDTIDLALSETNSISTATPISSSDTITVALSESGSILLSVQTDPAFDLKPGYPSTAVGNFLFGHVTVHAEQNISVSGVADGWSPVGSVIDTDLANVVLTKTAAGQVATASIDWHGDNTTVGGSVPTIVGAGTGVSGSDPAVDLAVPYPAVAIQANDLLVIQVAIRTSTSTTATASGFTQLNVDRISPISQFQLTKFAAGGETGTVAVNWGASSVDAIAFMFVVRGVALTDFSEGGSVVSGSSATITVPSVTTTGSNRLVLAFPALAGHPRTFAPAAGETGGDYTEPFAEYGAAPSAGAGITAGVNTAGMSSAGTISGGTITASGSNSWLCRALALKPLPASGSETGSRVAASVIYAHEITAGDIIKSVTTTQGTGLTVTFPSVTLASGDTGLAFLSFNGIGLGTTDPTSTWTFVAVDSTAEGDGASWALYDATTSPTNGTLAINVGLLNTTPDSGDVGGAWASYTVPELSTVATIHAGTIANAPDATPALRAHWEIGDEYGFNDICEPLVGLPLSQREAIRLTYMVYLRSDIDYTTVANSGGSSTWTILTYPGLVGGQLWPGTNNNAYPTGGAPQEGDNWSARIRSNAAGQIAPYLYVQNRPGAFGWHRISSHPLRINDLRGRWSTWQQDCIMNTPGVPNGRCVFRIDGDVIVDVSDIEYRSAGFNNVAVNGLRLVAYTAGIESDVFAKVAFDYWVRSFSIEKIPGDRWSVVAVVVGSAATQKASSDTISLGLTQANNVVTAEEPDATVELYAHVDVETVSAPGFFNAWDHDGSVVWTHTDASTITSKPFYTGTGTNYTFRFGGTKIGLWTGVSSGSNGLGGHTWIVEVIASTNPNRTGFTGLTSPAWRWAAQQGPNGTLAPIYPVWFMPPSLYHPDNQALWDSPTLIDDLLERFQSEGAGGLHIIGAAAWYGQAATFTGSTPTINTAQMQRAERMVIACREKGMQVYFWMWNDSTAQTSSPSLSGGIGGSVEQRLMKHIVGRFGPIAGWCIGAGYDTDEWMSQAQFSTWLNAWNTQGIHGGYHHFVGARYSDGGDNDSTNNGLYTAAGITWNTTHAAVRQFADWEQWENLTTQTEANGAKTAVTDRPHISGDRFRVIPTNPAPKDFATDSEMVPAVWKFNIAGMGGIWGKLNTAGDHFPGSQPLTATTAQRMLCARLFWTSERMAAVSVHANALSSSGAEVLRSSDSRYFIAYDEGVSSIVLNISAAPGDRRVIRVNALAAYAETDMGNFSPGTHTFNMGSSSNWALWIDDGDTPGFSQDFTLGFNS